MVHDTFTSPAKKNQRDSNPVRSPIASRLGRENATLDSTHCCHLSPSSSLEEMGRAVISAVSRGCVTLEGCGGCVPE